MNVIGIDLGSVKSGVCWIADGKVSELKSVPASELTESLDLLARIHGDVAEVVVDAPMAAGGAAASAFRRVDRVFMRGLFNNNHAGLQPNNPALLDLGVPLEDLADWCSARLVRYSNEFPAEGPRVREAMPNVALGVLADPAVLLAVKQRLRFRYGRGASVAPIVVAFEALLGSNCDFLRPLTGGSVVDWSVVEARDPEHFWQADDLVSAATCACLGWQDAQGIAGYVSDPAGHYLLPPLAMARAPWVAEVRRILADPDFGSMSSSWRP